MSTTLLARYWADLLNDYWSIAVAGSAPRRLIGLHDGEALTALFRALEDEAGEARGDLQTLMGTLPTSVPYHLQQLAGTVPMDYGNSVKEGL